jgi:hypothetical protein
MFENGSVSTDSISSRQYPLMLIPIFLFQQCAFQNTRTGIILVNYILIKPVFIFLQITSTTTIFRGLIIKAKYCGFHRMLPNGDNKSSCFWPLGRATGSFFCLLFQYLSILFASHQPDLCRPCSYIRNPILAV